jgi:hypothetical protein
MRYIDKGRLAQPAGWLARAQAAKEAVAMGDDPDRYGDIWRELKDGLAELFHDKCWYCEVQVPRADNAVDHFRPKKRVSDAQNPHSGYRWLAFDPANFRYACTFCNCKRKDVDGDTEGGKADRFPLMNEVDRLYVEGPIHNEQPALLDPCELNDWRLLGCQKENGKPCAASSEPEHKLRAEISIELYHLHHNPTCKLRHGAAVQLISDIEDAKAFFIAGQTDRSQLIHFKKFAEKILRAISPSQPFSGEMRFLLGGERDANHAWIQGLLET